MKPVNDIAAKLALPARWLIVGGIAYTLATSVLYFLSPPVTPGAGVTATRERPAEPAPAVDINRIVSRDLFGATDAEPEAAVSNEPTRQTQLPLELLGVFVADQPENSAAIISQRGRPGLLYDVGEDVPGNATLVEVHAKHVVLRRAGVREALNFPELSESLAARTRNVPQTFEEPPVDDYDEGYAEEYDNLEDYADDIDEQASVEELVNEYREELEADPSQALEELGVEPVSAGAAEGYRVGNLAQSPYLSQTGLQPGDVILSVNGRPVGDLEQDRLELDNVLAQGSARLEVQRGSRRFFVTATLQ